MNKYREMTLDDIHAAFRVRTSTVENPLTMQRLRDHYNLTPETLAEAIQGSLKGWVCEVDNEVVGFAMGDSQAGELSVLAVLPEQEGKGIGKNLLELVEQWLKQHGHNEIWLMTTPDPTLRAYALYKSKGWVPTGEIMDEDEKFVKTF